MAKGSYIGQVQIGDNTYPVGSILYGTASYDTTNNYWVVNNNNLTTTTFTNNNLTPGVTIHIKFNAINSADTPKLKVGAATEKAIVKYGTTNVGKSAATSWVANSIVSFTYDGTSWVMNTGIDSNDNTTYLNGTGISIDANNKINHSNSITAQNTQGVYPITVDAQGHIASMGTKVTLGAAAGKGVDTSIAAGSTSGNVPTSAAVANLISTATSGLTGAMHFKGSVESLPSATDSTTFSTYNSGDVILVGDKEYVYNKGQNAAGSSWILLGDEGSYALKTSTISVGSASGWSAGTTPTLGTAFSIPNVTSVGSAPTLGTAFSIPNVTNKGSAASFSVNNGTLTLTAGSAPTLGTAFSVPNVTSVGSAPTLGTAFSVPNVTNVGTAPSLTVTPTTVIKP